ncbi:MAG: hypothetical protein ACRD0L_08825 [Acidimicrobiales bacterium]
MSDDIEEGGPRHISRRTLIKGGAVVGGTIWAAPVIESLVSGAGAETTASGGSHCCSCSGATTSKTAYCQDPAGAGSAAACKSTCKGMGFTTYTFCSVAPGGGSFGCSGGTPSNCTVVAPATSADCTTASTT